MKKLSLFLLVIFSFSAVRAQFVYKIKADSVLITNDSCTAELIIENSTKNVKGFLVNKGNGRTEFRRAQQLTDSSFIIAGDTIVIRGSEAGMAWRLTGNAGTDPANNFLGTIDSLPLIFRTKNIERARIMADGNMGIGVTSPVSQLHLGKTLNFSASYNNISNTLSIENPPTVSVRYHTSYNGMIIPATNTGDFGPNTNPRAVFRGDYDVKSGAIGLDSGSYSFPAVFSGRMINRSSTFTIDRGILIEGHFDPGAGTIRKGIGLAAYGLGRPSNSVVGLLLNTSSDDNAGQTVPSGRYGIFDNTGYQSYFAGNVGIGTTSPSYPVDIKTKTSNIISPFISIRDSLDFPYLEIRGQRSPVGSALQFTSFFIGRGAGANLSNAPSNSTTRSNYGFGDSALAKLTTGVNSIGIGYKSLWASKTGIGNIGIGAMESYIDTAGTNCVLIGNAVMGNTYANRTTAIGAVALGANSSLGTAFNAVGIGDQVGFTNAGQSRDSSVLIGSLAGFVSTGLKKCVLLGFAAGFNQALGGNKLYIANSSTSNPLVYGEFDNNILSTPGKFGIGTKAPAAPLHIVGSTDGVQQMIILPSTQTQANPVIQIKSSNNDTLIEARAQYATGSGSGFYRSASMFIGRNAGVNNSVSPGTNNGSANTGIGDSALFHNTIGAVNTAVGVRALRDNTTGNYNTAVGHIALGMNTTGTFNTAIGEDCLSHVTTGSSNTAVGLNALKFMIAGTDNTAVGVSAGSSLMGGSYNTLIGRSAGYDDNESTLIGHKNTMLGYRAGFNCGADTGNILIGYDVGEGNYSMGNNKLFIANDATTTPLIYGEFDNKILSLSEASGKFGIRTKTPEQALHVVGQAKIDTITTGSGTDSILVVNNGVIKKISRSIGSGSLSIGDAIGSGTAGSILYLDGSGNLAQANSDFRIDPSTKWISIGHNNPELLLDLRGPGSTTDAGSLATFGSQASAEAGNLYGIAINKSGIDAYFIGINKNSTTGSVPANSAYLSSYSPSGTLSFGRGANNGLPNTTDLFIASDGNVGIGTSDTWANLHVKATTPVSLIESADDNQSYFRLVESWGPEIYLGGYMMYDGSINTLQIGTHNTEDTDAGNDIPAISIPRSGGKVGIGQTSPTAGLHLPASTSSIASIRIPDGTAPSSPNDGDIWHESNNLTFNTSSVNYILAKTLTATATLNFGSTAAQNSTDLTITIPGATDGDVVYVGVPSASVNANTCYTAFVSSTNTVTVRFSNYSSGAVDPASGTFRVSVLKY